MYFHGCNLVTVLAVMFSLTACASCSTVSDGLAGSNTETIKPSTDSDKEGSDKENHDNENNDTDNMNYSEFPLTEGENGKAPSIRLNSGFDMPIVGLVSHTPQWHRNDGPFREILYRDTYRKRYSTRHRHI